MLLMILRIYFMKSKWKLRNTRYTAKVKQPIADCLLYAKPKSFLFRCKVARKIKEIKLKYDRIVKQVGDANTIRSYLHLDQPVRNRTFGEPSMPFNVEDSKIPKRDQEKDELISKILEPNQGADGRTVISIVGLGGSGKTTLARHIYSNSTIKKHFNDKVFWVHVSREFDVKKLIGKLFEAIVVKKADLHVEQNMLREISKKISGKKFLLVLDDAWNPDKHDWELFMVHLKSGAPGSKILLTTRDLNVAEIVNSWHICHLEYLSEAESWSLFLMSSGSAWVDENLCSDSDSDFIQVGKEILNKCGGVPLAIRTLGGILCQKKQISIWKTIRDNDLWTNNGIQDRVFASLKLSFIYLADELKQCFTFCSIFPKGYEIHKDRLISQWVAHGFINAMNGMQPEFVGCDYFDSLVKVGFLHDPIEDWQSQQLVWKMHDLIHDLARHILHDEVVMQNKNMTTNSTHRRRYLSLTTCTEKKVDRGLFDKVHALYISGDNPSFNKPVKKSCFVRSVTLHYTMNTPFPQFILKFAYVGYLEIRNLQSIELPEAISGCWNLQALIFIDCSGFVTLPETVGKLKKLRTLELRDIKDLESLPLSLGDCRDLQYLKLYSCRKLRKIPISLRRNGSLKLLQIVNCHDLKKLPSEFTGEFSNLQTFSIANCSYFKDLPAALSCPMLCTLDLSDTKVTMLPQWVTTISTLECINLRGCKHLVELPKGIGKLKRLAVLNVEFCTKLRCMPSGIGQLTRLTQLGVFVVGCGGDDARISELENLNKLSGDMKIINLKYLKDPCDAQKACMKRKSGIQNLVLNWSPIDTEEEEMVSATGQDLAVLNYLEPPPDVKELEIQCYTGPSLPHWALKQNEDSSYCEGIMLKQTGSCHQFPSLTKLTLWQFPNLKHMRGLLVFPLLKSLSLIKMDNLQELWTTTTSDFKIPEEELRAQYCFPVLSYLLIRECPKLSTVKPYFPPSLESLCLSTMDWPMLSPGNFSHLLSPPTNELSSSCSQHLAVPRLRELTLVDVDMMRSSSGWEFLQYHPELEILHIENCNHMTQLPDSIRSLTFLQLLEINWCSTLGVLPTWLGELRSLRRLNIAYNKMIGTLPESIGHLTSLTMLDIDGLENLKQLPDEIQHLISLKFLNLSNCGALTALPESIGELSALRQLWIQHCPALECLPQSIQRLTGLQSLHINHCPALARRYKQGVGPDWHLVSHIPDVGIYPKD